MQGVEVGGAAHCVLMVAGCHLLYVDQSVSVEAGNVRNVCVGAQEAVSAFSLAGGTIYR